MRLEQGTCQPELVYLKSEVGDRQSCCAAAVAVATLSIESVRDDKPISIGSRSVKSSQALPFRIVKLGGSLLDWRETPKKIAKWIAQQTPARNVWVVGGGNFVDQVRKWDQSTPIDDADAHWICVDLMSINARLVRSWFPSWPIVKCIRTLNQSTRAIFFLIRAIG